MNKFTITLLLSLTSFCYFSQNNKLDSLYKLLRVAKNDTIKINLLNDISKQSYLAGNNDSIIVCSKKALILSEKNNYLKGIFIASRNIGYVYYLSGENKKALKYYQKALDISQKLHNKKQESDILDVTGLVYENQANYKLALTYFIKALKIREAIHYKLGIARTLEKIGIIYYNESNDSKALEYYFKALKLKKELADSVGIAITLHNIALTYETQNKIDKAIKMYLSAIKIKQKISKDPENRLATSYNNLGSCYKKINQIDSAFFYRKKAYSINKEKKNARGIELSAFGLSKDFFELNQIDSSLFYARIALDYSEKIGDLFIKKNVYRLYSQIYKQKSKFKLALKYNELSQAINDSIYNQDSQRIITEMNTKYETEKKQKENENLSNENKIKSLEIREQQSKLINQRILVIALTLLIIVILSMSWLIISRRELKQKEILKTELLNQQELRTKAIIEAQEIERKRLAMDLHDGIGQTLASAKMNMVNIGDEEGSLSEEVRNQVELTIKLVDDAYKEVREIAHQMMPKSLRDIGLEEALRDLLKKTLVNTNIKYAFEKNNFVRLNETIEIALYRIFQELLTNILKHANATKIIVNLHITKLRVVLIVEDNGIGITKGNTDSPGIGLSNIQTRINTLNGTFEISNGEIEGTIAIIRVPFHQNDLLL